MIVGVCVRRRAAHRGRRGVPARSRTGGTCGSSTTSTSPTSAPPRRSARTSPPRRPTAARSTCRPTTPVAYEDAPPAFGPHWNEPGLAPAPMDRKLYTEDDRPSSRRSCTTSSTATRSSGTTRPSPTTTTRCSSCGRIADKLAGTDNFRNEVHRRPVDVRGRGRQDVPRRPARRASPTGRPAARTQKEPGRSACGSTAPRCRGEALEDFMLEYPYTRLARARRRRERRQAQVRSAPARPPAARRRPA